MKQIDMTRRALLAALLASIGWPVAARSQDRPSYSSRAEVQQFIDAVRHDSYDTAIKTPDEQRTLDQLLHFFLHVISRRTHRTGNVTEHMVRLDHEIERALPGHRLDAAHTGGDAAFADDPEQADVAGP